MSAIERAVWLQINNLAKLRTNYYSSDLFIEGSNFTCRKLSSRANKVYKMSAIQWMVLQQIKKHSI